MRTMGQCHYTNECSAEEESSAFSGEEELPEGGWGLMSLPTRRVLETVF